jgi:hypothetical protein
MEKIIYLDWNVIQYCKNPRTDNEIDKEFLKLINTLKQKYKFPFAEGHLCDLSSSYNNKENNYVNEDLDFLLKISDGFALGYDNNIPILSKQVNIKKEFCDIMERNKEIIAIKMIPEFPPIKIDLQQMNKKSLFYPVIKDNDGYFSAKALEDFLLSITNIFDDNDKYKQYRNEVAHLKDNMLTTPNTVLDKNSFLFDCIIDYLSIFEINKISILEKEFYSFVEKHMKMCGKEMNRITVKDKIEIGYMMLDIHPLFSENIKKRNKLINITRDCKHLCAAVNAEYFISDDNSIYNKGKFIYKVFDIKTKIKKMKEFYYKFD